MTPIHYLAHGITGATSPQVGTETVSSTSVQTGAGPSAHGDTPAQLLASKPCKAGRILVVEDCVQVAEMTRQLLEASGFEALTVYTGLDAIETLDREPVELVLLDIDLPDISGFDVIRRLHGHARLASLPVIFFTGRNTPEVRHEAERLGAAGFVGKPFQLGTLLSEIHTVLAGPGADPAPAPPFSEESAAADGLTTHATTYEK